METIQLFTAELRYTDETTPVVPPETKRLGMKSGLFVLGTAAAAVVYCFRGLAPRGGRCHDRVRPRRGRASGDGADHERRLDRLVPLASQIWSQER